MNKYKSLFIFYNVKSFDFWYDIFVALKNGDAESIRGDSLIWGYANFV